MIKAFVGHSFNPADEPMWLAFREVLDTIQRNRADFTWKDAKIPEGKGISQKVRDLVADCDTMIAICSAHSVSARPGSLRSALGPTYGPRSVFVTKPSDWIVQEIGLAVGRNMSLIILLERGVSKSQGLEADAEYIEFERENIPATMGPLMDVLSSISGLQPLSGGGTTLVTTEADVSSSKDGEVEVDEGFDFATPKPSWTKSDYEIAFIVAVASHDKERAVTIDE